MKLKSLPATAPPVPGIAFHITADRKMTHGIHVRLPARPLTGLVPPWRMTSSIPAGCRSDGEFSK